MPFALGGWTFTTTDSIVGALCQPNDTHRTILVKRGGYYLACGPGSAVVTFKGVTYRMKGSRCFISTEGARLYFGAQRWSRPLPPPLNGLYLVVGPNRNGAVDVGDGGVELASGVRAPILGTAQATNSLRRGTFTIFWHLGSGKTDSRRFTGSWRCG